MTVISIDSVAILQTCAVSHLDLTGCEYFARVRTQGRNKVAVQIFA
jgi:hypothetical protein